MGLPALPPLNADNPRDSLLFADRIDAVDLSDLPPLSATSNEALGFSRRLECRTETPSDLLDDSAGDIVPGAAYDPLAGTLAVHVAGSTSLECAAIHDSNWSALFSSAPNPIAPSSGTTVAVDAPSGASRAWVFAGGRLAVQAVREDDAPPLTAVTNLWGLNVDERVPPSSSRPPAGARRARVGRVG